MAPRRKQPVRNYSRNVSYNRSARNILHNILTNPIQKKKDRRKPKIEIKELPPLSKHTCFTNESDSHLEMNFNDDNTFDRLLKEPNYNVVNFKPIGRNNSSSECSLSMLHIKKKHSPIRKKRRIVNVRTRSPVVTRSVSLQNSSSSTNKCNLNQEDENKGLRTLERSVNESLYIEKVQVHKQKSTTHFSISFDSEPNSIPQLREPAKENGNSSFEPMFSKTFIETYKCLNVPLLANASTPVAPLLDQKLVNETIISPIVNLDNEKLESITTPKLRRVSKVRRSRLLHSVDYENPILGQENIENDNQVDRNAVSKENSALNDRNKENTSDSSLELVSNSRESISNRILSKNFGELNQNNSVKDLSNLFKNAVVNVTLLNTKCLRTPFGNLTNIQIGPFRNKFNLNNTENNMLRKLSDHKIAVANVTFIDFERYLYHLHKNVSREVLPEKDASETKNLSKIYRKPFVDITNINIKDDIILKCSTNKGDTKQSIKLNSNSSSRSFDTPSDSENSSKSSDMQTTNEEWCMNTENVDLVRCQPVVNITKINLEHLLTPRSRSSNLKEISTPNEPNQKERCSNNSQKGPHQNLSDCSKVDYQNIQGASTMIENNQLDLRHSSPFRGFPRNTSHIELSNVDNETSSEFEDVNLTFPTVKRDTPPYITLRRRKVPKVTPIKRSKHRSKTKDAGSKSRVIKDFEPSYEESTNFNEISAENCTDLAILDGASVNVKEMISEDEILILTPQTVSPDIFKSTSVSIDAESITKSPENKENCLQSPPNRNISLEGNSAISIDSSVVDTSYVNFTFKGSTGFSFKTGKRSRVSQFKQCTSADNEQSTNRSSLLDIIENTPINITKRNKISYTPKKNIVTIDLGKKRSTKNKRSTNRLNLQPAVDQVDLNDPVACNCSLNSSSMGKVSQRSQTKSKNLLKRLDFQPEISDGYSLQSSTVPKTSTTSKRESNTLKISDFPSEIDRSKVNEQLAGDNETNASVVQKIPKTSKGEARESSRKQDFQPVSGELKLDDANANHRGSDVFAVPKLPILKKAQNPKEKIVLKPGKLWRRSLIEVRNSKIGLPSDRQSFVHLGDNSCACDVSTPRRSSIRVVPLADFHDVTETKSNSVLENYAISCRKTSCLPLNILRESSLEDSLKEVSLNKEEQILEMSVEVCLRPQEVSVTAREVVLRKCGQTEPIPFRKCYPNSILQNCQKIGEGVYGEVFLFRDPTSNLATVIKIIPIEGDLIVNGEHQKKFEEVLSEITIGMELSDLRTNRKNTTDCFSELKKVNCIQGKYPKQLLNLWKLYNETKCSENDDPEMFGKDQLYISLELADGGNSMESFVFNNSQQAYSLVTQVAYALSVAENSLEFEHRDLHWGNVLISNTDIDDIAYNLDGKCLKIPSHGIQLAIIDFTLSRISHDGVCLYNDLSVDPDLFTATGDYQFEIYRLMKKHNKNDWQRYQPYTNVLWLHYIVDKTINGVRYRNKTSKIHKQYLRQLQEFRSTILQYKNVNEFVASQLF